MRKSAILTSALALGVAATAFGESAWVKPATLDLHQGKGAVFPTVVTVPKGTELTVVSRDGHWVQVQAGSQTGWVFDGSISSSKVGGDVSLMPGANAEMGTGIAARGLEPGAEVYVSSRGLSKAPLDHLIALRKSIPPQEWVDFTKDVHK
jgi:uncharacterized protein YraI